MVSRKISNRLPSGKPQKVYDLVQNLQRFSVKIADAHDNYPIPLPSR
jgi:hypothetical protein